MTSAALGKFHDLYIMTFVALGAGRGTGNEGMGNGERGISKIENKEYKKQRPTAHSLPVLQSLSQA